MQASMRLPVAFSVHDEHEFFPLLHLMRRMNAKLVVTPVVTGRHINGSCPVLWGLAHEEGQPIAEADMQNALREAGFDFQHPQGAPALAGILSQLTG